MMKAAVKQDLVTMRYERLMMGGEASPVKSNLITTAGSETTRWSKMDGDRIRIRNVTQAPLCDPKIPTPPNLHLASSNDKFKENHSPNVTLRGLILAPATASCCELRARY